MLTYNFRFWNRIVFNIDNNLQIYLWLDTWHVCVSYFRVQSKLHDPWFYRWNNIMRFFKHRHPSITSLMMKISHRGRAVARDRSRYSDVLKELPNYSNWLLECAISTSMFTFSPIRFLLNVIFSCVCWINITPNVRCLSSTDVRVREAPSIVTYPLGIKYWIIEGISTLGSGSWKRSRSESPSAVREIIVAVVSTWA